MPLNPPRFIVSTALDGTKRELTARHVVLASGSHSWDMLIRQVVG
mgnify:CR=1 FL=1